MYCMTICCTIAAWILGLLLDANLDFYPQGFLCLRILLPMLALGLCILRNQNRSRDEQRESSTEE